MWTSRRLLLKKLCKPVRYTLENILVSFCPLFEHMITGLIKTPLYKNIILYKEKRMNKTYLPLFSSNMIIRLILMYLKSHIYIHSYQARFFLLLWLMSQFFFRYFLMIYTGFNKTKIKKTFICVFCLFHKVLFNWIFSWFTVFFAYLSLFQSLPFIKKIKYT